MQIRIAEHFLRVNERDHVLFWSIAPHKAPCALHLKVALSHDSKVSAITPRCQHSSPLVVTTSHLTSLENQRNSRGHLPALPCRAHPRPARVVRRQAAPSRGFWPSSAKAGQEALASRSSCLFFCLIESAAVVASMSLRAA